MSKLFTQRNYPIVPFGDSTGNRIMALPMTLYTPTNEQPRFAPIKIDWKLYNANGAIPNVGIDVNLGQLTSGGASLGRIASVFIDNSTSNVPVYVVMADTGFTVPCGPGDSVTTPVITSDTAVKIYGVGFTGGSQPRTDVYFTNQVLQPSQSSDFHTVIPQLLCSTANVAVANNTPYRAQAAGDRMLAATCDLTALGYAPARPGFAFDWVWPNDFANISSGAYVYITAISMMIAGSRATLVGATPPYYGYVATLGLWDTVGAARFLADHQREIIPDSSVTFTEQLFSWTGLQIKAQIGINNRFSFGYFDGEAMYYNNATQYFDNAWLRVSLVYTARDERTLY
jgi:hypothetical protein